MSLATQSKLPERPTSKGRDLGRGASLDKPTPTTPREAPRGRGRPSLGERGRGRGSRRNIHDTSGAASSSPPIRLTASLLKDHLPVPSTTSITPKDTAFKQPPPSPKPKLTPTTLTPPTTSQRARSKSPQPKSPQDTNRIPPSVKQPTSNNSHPRSRRGRRLKNKEPPANLKPLSLEDAFASLKCNPFDGEPLKTPLVLTPLPQSQSSARLTPQTPNGPGKFESREDSYVALLAVPVTPEPPTSRPVTPVTHIDWAEDDDEDSLPDLDDWVTSSTKVVVSGDVEEETSVKEDPPMATASQEEPIVIAKNELSACNIESPPAVKDQLAVESPKIITEGIEEVPNGQTQKPGEAIAGHSEATTSNDSEHPIESSIVESVIPAEQTTLVQEESWRSRPSHKRPNSMASPYIRPNRNAYAAQFDRMHSRTLSLPQVTRPPGNSRTRPVISAAGLTRLSRTLGRGGLNPAPKVSGSPAPAIAD